MFFGGEGAQAGADADATAARRKDGNEGVREEKEKKKLRGAWVGIWYLEIAYLLYRCAGYLTWLRSTVSMASCWPPVFVAGAAAYLGSAWNTEGEIR